MGCTSIRTTTSPRAFSLQVWNLISSIRSVLLSLFFSHSTRSQPAFFFAFLSATQHTPFVRALFNLFAKLDGKYCDFSFYYHFRLLLYNKHIYDHPLPSFFFQPHHLFFFFPHQAFIMALSFLIVSVWVHPQSLTRTSQIVMVSTQRLCLHLIYLLLSTRLRYRRISYRHHVLMLCAKSLKLFVVDIFFLFSVVRPQCIPFFSFSNKG